MSTAKPRSLLRIEYEKAAEAYLRSLPPEHFMEETPQATQRKITLESFDLVHCRRPDVHLFNELLVQYPRPPRAQIRQVVPDNMAVVHGEPIRATRRIGLVRQPLLFFAGALLALALHVQLLDQVVDLLQDLVRAGDDEGVRFRHGDGPGLDVQRLEDLRHLPGLGEAELERVQAADLGERLGGVRVEHGDEVGRDPQVVPGAAHDE
jgi:hypothetical protein